MTTFSQQFHQAMNIDSTALNDYGYLDVQPAIPRIRFKLGVAFRKRIRRLATAEMRCAQLLDSITPPESELWLALDFFTPSAGNPKQRTATETLRILGNQGLQPKSGNWMLDDLGCAPDAVSIGHRYSAMVATNTQGFRLLSKIVVWGDFGMWNGHACDMFFLSPTKRVLFHPYDDRGADLLAPSTEILQPWNTRFNDWIMGKD